MQTTTLFVLGLVVGALVVFGVRAASLEDATGEVHAASHEAHGAANPVEHHASADAAPAPPGDHPDAQVSDRPPENLICPVMGNEVDPTVYVDYQGRRIGFCCPGCDEAFLADPEKYLKKVDAELRARGER